MIDDGTDDDFVKLKFIQKTETVNLTYPTIAKKEKSILRNNFTKNTLATVRILVVSSAAAIGSFPFCSQLGLAFIKTFQIIEILSKLIYIPADFSGIIYDLLSNISELSDPIEISPHI